MLGRHTLPLSMVLSSADSLVLVLTDSVRNKTAGWVLQPDTLSGFKDASICVSYTGRLGFVGRRAMKKTVGIN